MNTESGRNDLFVASTAAGATVILATVFALTLPAEPSIYLQIVPLGVYFLYLFVHRRLPDRVDQRATWAGLAVAVAAAAYLVAVL